MCLSKVEWTIRSEVTLKKGCKNVANEAALYIVSGRTTTAGKAFKA